MGCGKKKFTPGVEIRAFTIIVCALSRPEDHGELAVKRITLLMFRSNDNIFHVKPNLGRDKTTWIHHHPHNNTTTQLNTQPSPNSSR